MILKHRVLKSHKKTKPKVIMRENCYYFDGKALDTLKFPNNSDFSYPARF